MTKTREYIKQLRDKTADELTRSIEALKLEIEQKKVALGFGKIKNVKELTMLKKNLARMLTIHGEKLAGRDIILKEEIDPKKVAVKKKTK